MRDSVRRDLNVRRPERDTRRMRWSLPGALFCIWALLFGVACADLLLDSARSYLLAAGYGAGCVACIKGAHHTLFRSPVSTRRPRHS